MKPWDNMTDKEKNACIAEHIMKWPNQSKFEDGAYCVTNPEPSDYLMAFDPLDNPRLLRTVEDKIHDMGWSTIYTNRLIELIKGDKEVWYLFDLLHASMETRCHAMYLMIQRMLEVNWNFDILHITTEDLSPHMTIKGISVTLVATSPNFVEGLTLAAAQFHDDNETRQKKHHLMYCQCPVVWQTGNYQFYLQYE